MKQLICLVDIRFNGPAFFLWMGYQSSGTVLYSESVLSSVYTNGNVFAATHSVE